MSHNVIVAPNATFTDDSKDQIVSRIVARLAEKGATLENIACDGWENSNPDTIMHAGRAIRVWLIDAVIDGVWGCIAIHEWAPRHTKSGPGTQTSVGLYSPSEESDPAAGHSAAFRKALGWRRE